MLLGAPAFGGNSRLDKKLVIQEQKVQFIGASIPMNRDLPLFEIYSMVMKVDDVNYVRDEIYRTLEQFKSTLVEEKKLADHEAQEQVRLPDGT